MKNRLSYTAIERYLTCPKSWFLYYLRGIREKYIGSALPFGNAFDEGLNVLLNPKEIPVAETFVKENIKDAHDTFETKMQQQTINGQKVKFAETDLINYGNEDFDFDVLTEDDIVNICEKINFEIEDPLSLQDYHEELLKLKKAWKLKGDALKNFNYMSYISLKRKGHLFLDAYHDQILPLIKRVIAVQEEFAVENTEGDSFSGKIDLIVELHDGRYVIFDNKTSAQAYKEDRAYNSKQLASYYGVLTEMGFFEKYNIPKDKLFIGYITIVKKIRKKKEPKIVIQVIINNINEELVDEVFTEYDLVNEKIHNGEFPSNRENCKSKNFGKCFCELKANQIVDISKDWGKKK